MTVSSKSIQIIQQGETIMYQIDQDMHQCIQNCLDCHSFCSNTVMYCLQKGGMHAELAHIRLMLDCAEICQTSANFMLRGSELHTRTCGICAEICDRCAASCRQMSMAMA